MDRAEALRIIDATLKARGFREVGPGAADYEGPIRVHGQPVDVIVEVPDVRFATRPRVHVKDRSQIPLDVLAHVEEETGVCYASGGGIPLDMYRPGETILRVLEEASRTLGLSYKGRGTSELIDEYQHYWFPKLTVRSFLPRQRPYGWHDAVTFFAMEGDQVAFIALAESSVLRGYRADFPTPARVLYINDRLGPAGGVGAPSTLSELRDWAKAQPCLGISFRRESFSALAQRGAVFIAAQNAFVGLKLVIPRDLSAGLGRGTIRRHAATRLLEARAHTVTIERLSASWSDLDQVTARNSPEARNLSEVSIALVGAGTVGSHLARMLVQCGAGAHAPFTIFDRELLSEGNIGRHLLGFASVGSGKAEALKAELERFHPQVTVRAVSDNALPHWAQLAQHDLIIDATGDWNVQSALNASFMASTADVPKALLHSFVFMNGAGVQSFLNLRDEHACFRCLKPVFDGPWRYPAGNEKEPLNLRPASCGDGSYIPFTVEASTMAASLALRAALDWANGHPGPRLRSAVVDLRRGRYQKPVSPPPSPQCPACAQQRLNA